MRSITIVPSLTKTHGPVGLQRRADTPGMSVSSLESSPYRLLAGVPLKSLISLHLRKDTLQTQACTDRLTGCRFLGVHVLGLSAPGRLDKINTRRPFSQIPNVFRRHHGCRESTDRDHFVSTNHVVGTDLHGWLANAPGLGCDK
jgi:hypothetical protein